MLLYMQRSFLSPLKRTGRAALVNASWVRTVAIALARESQ
jgi:hypothetical protein